MDTDLLCIELQQVYDELAVHSHEVSSAVTKQAIADLSGIFQEAIKNGVVFHIPSLAEAFSRAANNSVSTKELAFAILEHLPLPDTLDDEAKQVLEIVIAAVEDAYPSEVSSSFTKGKIFKDVNHVENAVSPKAPILQSPPENRNIDAENFFIAIECWRYSLANYPVEMSSALVHAVLLELQPSFVEAIEKGVVFNIADTAKQIAKASKYVTPENDIAFTICSLLSSAETLEDKDRHCLWWVYQQMLSADPNLLSIEELDIVLRSSSSTEAWFIRRVAQMLQVGGYQKKGVIDEYNEAFKLKLDDPSTWCNLGIMLRQCGKYEEAIAAYNKALESNPEHIEALIYRAIALNDTGCYKEEAISAFKKAILVKQNNHKIWFALGFLLQKLNYCEEAIASYDRALELKPDDAEVWNNRGNALSELGRYEEAIASFRKAFEINPYKYEGVYSTHLIDRGWYKEAVICFDKILGINPINYRVWKERGYALNELGLYQQAIESLDKAIECLPDYLLAWNERGFSLMNLGRYEEAVSTYDKVIVLKPRSFAHQVWYNRGIALQNLARYEEAITSYDKTLEIKSDFHAALYNKACCYGLQGNFELAIQNLQQAINLNPDKYREMAKIEPAFDRF